MKIKFTFFCLIFFSFKLIAKHNYYIGDTLYSWSDSALILYDNNEDQSKKIDQINPGEAIIVLQHSFWNDDTETSVPLQLNSEVKSLIKLKGRWLKVKYKDKEGYVLDVFLSRYPVYKKDESCLDFVLDCFIKHHFDLIRTKHQEFEEEIIKEQYFSNGVFNKRIGTMACVFETYYLPNLSANEIIFLLKKSGLLNSDVFSSSEQIECNVAMDAKIILKFSAALQSIIITEFAGITIVEIKNCC